MRGLPNMKASCSTIEVSVNSRNILWARRGRILLAEGLACSVMSVYCQLCALHRCDRETHSGPQEMEPLEGGP